jgi:hypothetical protein
LRIDTLISWSKETAAGIGPLADTGSGGAGQGTVEASRGHAAGGGVRARSGSDHGLDRIGKKEDIAVAEATWSSA